jgi:alpha-1,2-mannosyltransferase
MDPRVQSSKVHFDGTSLVCLLGLFLVGNALLLNGALWLLSPTGYNETVLQHTGQVLRGEGLDDSWGIMSQVLDYAQAPHATPLYTEIFFNRHIKFQYSPASLFAVSLMRLFGKDRIHVNEIYNGPWPPMDIVFGWAFLALMAAATALILELRLRETYPQTDWRKTTGLRAALVVGFTLTFYPVVKAFTLGQIQVWINAIFAVALLAWMLRWQALSGVLIGLISLAKPHYGLFLVWAALRSEWRFVVACIATGCLGLAASVAAFGLTDHLDYSRVLLFMFQRGETFYPNQSINGFLNRLMSIHQPELYGNLEFFIDRYAPFNAWIYGLTVAAALLVLLAALSPRPDLKQNHALDFCTMGLSATMASPIAWEHHYGILLPIFAVLLVGALGNRRQLIALGICYLLASNYFPITQLLAGSLLNIGQSYVLAAVLVVLALLYRQQGLDLGRIITAAQLWAWRRRTAT